MARRVPRSIPAFQLYGEAGAPGAELLHLEDLPTRSRRHGWAIDAHVHHGLHQVLWLKTGPAEVTLDAVRHRTEGPLVVVVPSGVAHGFRFTPASDGLVLTLGPRLLVEGDADHAGSALHALFAQAHLLPLADQPLLAPRIAGLFGELAAEVQAPGNHDSPVPLWLARALVWRLAQALQAARTEPGSPPALFNRFVVLVEQHHLDHWPVTRYASQLGLSVERLNRLARAHAGRAALALVHDRLAREAARRLVHVAAPVSTLAFELGFDDPAYFTRFFKRHTGRSPRQFRQEALGG